MNWSYVLGVEAPLPTSPQAALLKHVSRRLSH